ncbi:uncharacterized protein LOC110974272 isoform X2 [Acanthaster planci]|uniref:Uncharacterized protein LOC110974272 isoform X2 n=1 Tax=Acanthaster planci TaxID=133434 RepID=A0A8B7XMV6_ACAPL|nr:uncharacterized protein LOC110974272 isoform X2 [Acanthaster planci]
MSLIRVVLPGKAGQTLVGSDGGGKSPVRPAPHHAEDVLAEQAALRATSSIQRQGDGSSNEAIPTHPSKSCTDPPGSRRPLTQQFDSSHSIDDIAVCLPAINYTRAHAREDARCQYTIPGHLPTLQRSKKTTQLKVSHHPSDLHASTRSEGAATAINVVLSIEGQDLKLPPPRDRSSPRQDHQKQRHRLRIRRVAGGLGFLPCRYQNEDIRSLEEGLKTLLLCQSMGVIIQITRHRDDNGSLAQPVFHCDRCLRHWAVHGRPPPDCQEPESRVSGPSFALTSRSHEILQKFAQLTPIDKQCFLEAIQAETVPTTRGGDGFCLTESHRRNQTGMGRQGDLKRPAAGMGDKEAITVWNLKSQLWQVAEDLESNLSTHRSLHEGGQNFAKSLPNDVPKALPSKTNQEEVTKDPTSSAEGEPSCESEQADTVSSDERDTRGGPDCHTGQGGSDPSIVDPVSINTGLRTPVADQASYLSKNHIINLDKDMKFQTGESALPLNSIKVNQVPVDIHANYPGFESPETDGHESNEASLQQEPVPKEERQNTGENCSPQYDSFNGGKDKIPDGNFLSCSQDLADEPPSSKTVESPVPHCTIRNCITDTEIDFVTNHRIFQDSEQLFEDDTAAHAVSKVTVTRSRLLQYLSYGAASFNNSAGADEVETNESFEKLINGPDDLGVSDNKDGNRPLPSQGKGNRQKIPSSKGGVGKGLAGQKNRRDGSISYMGVIEDEEETLDRSTSGEGNDSSRGGRGHTIRGSKSASRDQNAVPIRNTAVRNVTGKPDTRPGNLEQHVFATPRETLAQSNAFGAAHKSPENIAHQSSDEGLTKATFKQKIHDNGNNGLESGSSVQSSSAPRRESLGSHAAATALPPLGTVPGQLPSLNVHDTEQRSRTKDRKRSLGLPRTDHARREFVNRKEEEGPTAGWDTGREPMCDPRASRKQPPPRAGEEFDTSKRQSLARQQVSGGKPNTQDYFADDVNTKENGEKGERGEKSTGFLPAIASAKEDLMPKEMDDQLMREREAKSPMKSLFSQFDNFELSLSPPPAGSLHPVSTDKSFRMTYSTLPRTFDWDTARQPPGVTRRTPSPQRTGPVSDLSQLPADQALNAKLMKPSMVVRPSSRDFYDKSARTPSRVSGKKTDVYSSSSETSRASSPAESVWETVSEVWRRHALELQKLERMVALNFLPLTSAFTFSVFEIPPQYLAHNRSLREQAMQIRRLKRPKKIVMKFASKEQREAAMKPPQIRRRVKPVA